MRMRMGIYYNYNDRQKGTRAQNNGKTTAEKTKLNNKYTKMKNEQTKGTNK